MRPILRTALAAVACVALAACSDEPTSASRTPSVVRPNLSVGVFDTIKVIKPCDINTLRSDARLYANKSNDLLLTIIGDLGSAVRSGPSTLGNERAFDGLARMAAIRGTPAQKPGVTGEVFDRLVRRFLGCMQANIYQNTPEPNPPTGTGKGPGFRQALGDGWVFEVRGKPTGTYPDPDSAAFERAILTPETWWAVDKIPTATSWVTSELTNRVLIFGWRTLTFIPSNERAGSSFEHRTLPDVNRPTTPDDGVVDYTLNVNVGLCFADDSQIDLANQRVNHASQFLPLAEQIRCGSTTPTAITPTTGSLVFGRFNPMHLAQRAASFFKPQPLYATTMFFGGSITGRPDDFSPSAVIDLSNVKLVFDPIDDGFVNTELKSKTPTPHPVRVYAYSLDNIAIPGVDVVVRIAGNNSSISFFGTDGTSPSSMTITDSTVTAPGNADGYAELKGVTLKKAGGYILSAQVNVAGVVGAKPFNSLPFNIQNK